jgi:hypothetical protein
MKKCFLLWSACALLVVTTACTKSSPARPTETSAAPAGEAVTSATVNGITLTTPTITTPVVGQRYRFAEQPLTFAIRNAASTGATALTYTFQIAKDGNFTNLAYSKDGVAEGTGGTTSLKIDKLAGASDYFVRVRANSGGSAGPFGAARAFNVGPEVILQAPVLTTPGNGGNLSGNGTLITNNVAKTGPAGPISYRFDVSDSSSFGNLVFTRTVSEGSNQTSVTMDAKLTSQATYFWRVTASDPSNAVTSPVSSTFSFKYVPFDMRDAVIVNSPPDLGSWPETAKITSINFSPGAFEVDFDKRDSPDRWPDMIPKGFAGPLQYTLGLCAQINGVWYCSGVVQFWYGRELSASAPPGDVGFEWFYNPIRWGPLFLHQPAEGELIGLWAAAGNLRDGADFTQASCPRVCERTNVQLIPWTNGFASYAYSSAFKAIATAAGKR